MPTQTGKQVTISEFQRNPAGYLGDEPVAVTRNGQVIGYAVGPDTFHAMVRILRAAKPKEEDLLEGLDADTGHADELATPSASEMDPEQKLKGSVKHYDQPFDPAGDWDDSEDH